MKEITAEEALKLSNEAKSRLERQSRDARAAASAVALTEFVFDIVKHTKGMLDNNRDLSVADAVFVAVDKVLETASGSLIKTINIETVRRYITDNYHVLVATRNDVLRGYPVGWDKYSKLYLALKFMRAPSLFAIAADDDE